MIELPAVALEVHRDERLVRHAEDAVHRSRGGRTERVVELLDRRRPARRSAVKSTTLTVGVGTRRLKPSNLPLRSGMTSASAFAAPVVVGMMFWPAASGATRILVGDVEDALVVRVAVDRVHEAALDRHEVVDDLGGRREAVRRAARVADDVVGSGVVAVLVDPEDDRDVLALGGGADDDLLRTGVDVRARLVGIREEAGALEDDVDAEVAPRQGGRVLLGEDLDLAAVDDDRGVAALERRPDTSRTSSRA